MPYNLNMENIIIHTKTCDMLPSISSNILHVNYSEHAISKSVQSSPIWRYIFILDLSSGYNVLGKDNCKTTRETFTFWIWCDLYEKFDGILKSSRVASQNIDFVIIESYSVQPEPDSDYTAGNQNTTLAA